MPHYAGTAKSPNELMDARILGPAKEDVRLRRRGSREDETMSGRLVDCREEVANPADGLLARYQPGTMRVEDDGRLLLFGAAVPGVSVIGRRAAGGLRADGRLSPIPYGRSIARQSALMPAMAVFPAAQAAERERGAVQAGSRWMALSSRMLLKCSPRRLPSDPLGRNVVIVL